MTIPLHSWLIIQIAIIAQAFFAAALLWFAPQNRQANRTLALLIASIALWLIDAFWRLSGVYAQDPNRYFSPIYYSLAFGPLLYFYVRSLTNHQFRLEWKHLWHFIPVGIQAGLYWFLYFQNYAFRLWYWESVHQPVTYRIEFDGTWISLLLYSYFSFQIIRGYQTWLEDNYSETERIKLNWLKILLVLLAFLGLQWLVELLLRDIWNIYYDYDLTHWFLALLVLAMGAAGLYQSSLAGVQYQETAAPKTPAEPEPVILEKIRRALEAEQLYLNPTLSLAELAATIQLPPKLVSQQINAGFGQSFNDLVNTYRVEAVKRRIQAGALEQMTLLGIAFESGFNSKTSFNRVFKRFTGIVPSAYTGE